MQPVSCVGEAHHGLDRRVEELSYGREETQHIFHISLEGRDGEEYGIQVKVVAGHSGLIRQRYHQPLLRRLGHYVSDAVADDGGIELSGKREHTCYLLRVQRE